MPYRIPSYFAQKPEETSRLPRAPAAQLADTGQGIEALAMAQTGDITTQIVAKWYEREGNSQFDSQRAVVQDMVGEFERAPFPDADSHKAGYKRLLSDIEKQAPKNKSGGRKFKSWTKLNRATWDGLSNEKMIRMIDRQNQIALYQNLDSIANQPDRKKAMAELKLLIQGGLDDGSIKTAAQAIALQERATNDWLGADLERRATSTIRPDGEIDFSEAVKYLAKAENIKGIPSDVTTELLRKLQAQETAQRRRDTEKHELLQEQTSRQMLTGFWDGTLTEPQLVTDALRNNLLSATDAKYLRNAMMNPEPPKTKLKALAEVNRAITDFGRGAISRDSALSVVYKNVSNLDPTTGKSKVNEIFTEQNRNNASMLNIGRGLMEELIRDKDPLSGMFTDDEKQIIATAEAELLLDAAIEDAVRLKKPLNRKDLLIEAINIGRRKKREIEALGDEGIKTFEFEEGMTTRLPPPIGDIPRIGEFGLRPDQTKKGKGFLGPLGLKGGGVATEYSVGVKLEANDGKETDIPTLVPTLTEKEIDTMVNDIIPNKKPVPKAILQKAVDHANKRVRAGKSPFGETSDSVKGKPPSKPPPKDRAYIGFTVLQDGTNIKWTWDGSKWQRVQ